MLRYLDDDSTARNKSMNVPFANVKGMTAFVSSVNVTVIFEDVFPSEASVYCSEYDKRLESLSQVSLPCIVT